MLTQLEQRSLHPDTKLPDGARHFRHFGRATKSESIVARKIEVDTTTIVRYTEPMFGHVDANV